MNLPNKLTCLRMILVPFFVFFLLTDLVPMSGLIALIIFAAASVTDALDGHIARSRGLVTTFGKFLDPLADKVLVISALVCFIQMGICGAVPVLIIIAREFMVSGMRLVTAGKGIVVPANIWGKLKTAFTMVTIVFILFIHAFALHGTVTDLVSDILIWISTVLTVISGWTYLNAYKGEITSSM
ncbi:MAG: CDP-diacylglycerol--glycerol-3-phosphate 3-phosphatidyltransferase [Oscillospiraceae bacterium]|nr:CDP-diacylglycerol--glycerol-3-phosphate 3-phosphatidyltransferase [Oscillospiraceae bacterium]